MLPTPLACRYASASAFELDDPAFQLDGYFLYACDAEVPAQGGVALYSRLQPKAVISGLGFETADRYGRYLDDSDVVISSFLLGGARQLSGFRQDAISGQNISLMRAVYYRRLTPRSYLPLDFPLYLGASLERGRAWNNDNEFDSGYINAASIFLGFDTPLGPLNFSYGFNDDNQKAVYLNLGQTF